MVKRHIPKSVNCLLGRWRNSAYSSVPSSILCSCNTKGRLVTIPGQKQSSLPCYNKHTKRKWQKVKNLTNRILEEESLCQLCSQEPKIFQNSAQNWKSQLNRGKQRRKKSKLFGTEKITWPPTTATVGRASQRELNALSPVPPPP